MSVAVIIVNYGVADLAAGAVDSVLSQTLTRDVEIHLVDNASPGDDPEKLKSIHKEREWGTRVTLWLEDQNHGFGEGNNVVLRALADRETKPEFVFLLNPDASLEGDAITELAKTIEADPGVAAAGAGLRDSNGAPATAAFRFPGMISELEHTASLGSMTRFLKNFRVALSPDLPAGPVDWVSGAAVMFRFQALMDVDFFDPDFFLYYEEVDLMRRLKERGWITYYVPSAKVLHHEGASTGVRQDVETKRNPSYLYHSWLVFGYSRA